MSAENKSRAARLLGVSRSSLYYQHKMDAKDELLRRRIEEVMTVHKGYGYRRVALHLGENKKRVQRVMKKFGLKPARRAKTPRKRADEGKEPQAYPNILKRVCPCVPNAIWASDFTYIWFQGSFIYLATVLDVFTGEVLGVNVATRHDTSLVLEALKRAMLREKGQLPNWFHSDQGSEFCAEAFQSVLKQGGCKISMSPKGSPWCNGQQESFFGRFKVEFGDFERFASLDELVEEIFAQVFYFNVLRIKTRLRLPPSEFRKKWDTQNSPTYTRLSTGYESPPTTPSCEEANNLALV